MANPKTDASVRRTAVYQGPKGDPGPRGATGLRGIQGAVGPTGPAGPVVADVRDFGAVCDGVTYDDDAWDAAIASMPAQGGIIYMSAGVSRVQRSHHISKSNVTIKGDGAAASRVFANNLDGAIFVFGPAIPAINTSNPALVSGPGTCLTFDGINHSNYLTFRRTVGLTDIDGFSSISWEFAIRPTAAPAEFASFLASSGRLYSADNIDCCFEIGINASNKVEARVNVSGTIYNIQTGVLVSGTVYEIELTLTGGNLYIFVNGVLADSTVSAGSLVQKAWEEFTIGGSTTDFPDGEFSTFAPNGLQIDAIRISTNQAQHTTNFSPTGLKKQFTGVGGTILLMNFDKQSGIFVVGSSSSVHTVWATSQKLIFNSLISQSGLEDINVACFSGQGALFFNAVECFAESCIFEGRSGLTIRNNCFLFESRDIKCLGSTNGGLGGLTWMGLESASAGGVYAWNGITQSHGFPFGMVVAYGDDHHIENFYTAANTALYGLIVKYTFNINVSSSLLSDEESSGSLISQMLLDQVLQCSIRGMAVGASNSVTPYAIAIGSTVKNISFYSCFFQSNAASTAVIDFHGGFAPQNTIQLINCLKSQPSVPWTDSRNQIYICRQDGGVITFDPTGIYQEGGTSQYVYDRKRDGTIQGERDSIAVAYLTGDNQAHDACTFALDDDAHTEVDVTVQASWGANSRVWYLKKAYSRSSGGAPVIANDGSGNVDILPRDTGTASTAAARITEVGNSTTVELTGLAATVIDWGVYVDRKIRKKSFKPTDPVSAACKLWLHADIGITSTTGSITAIADTSGNSNGIACATGHELALYSSRPVLNNKAAFGFATGGHSRRGDNATLGWGTNYTAIISLETGAFNNGYDLVWPAAANRFFGFNQSLATVFAAGLVQSASIGVGKAIIMRYEQSGAGVKLYVNGVLAASSATTVAAATGYTLCNDSIYSVPSVNYIRQVLAYDGVLSAPDAQAVEDYLRADVGLT